MKCTLVTRKGGNLGYSWQRFIFRPRILSLPNFQSNIEFDQRTFDQMGDNVERIKHFHNDASDIILLKSDSRRALQFLVFRFFSFVIGMF